MINCSCVHPNLYIEHRSLLMAAGAASALFGVVVVITASSVTGVALFYIGAVAFGCGYARI